MYRQMITELLSAWFLPYTVETKMVKDGYYTDTYTTITIFKWRITIFETLGREACVHFSSWVSVKNMETETNVRWYQYDIPNNLLAFLCNGVLDYSMKGDK